MSDSVRDDDRLSEVNQKELKVAIEGLDEDEDSLQLSQGASKLTGDVEDTICLLQCHNGQQLFKRCSKISSFRE